MLMNLMIVYIKNYVNLAISNRKRIVVCKEVIMLQMY